MFQRKQKSILYEKKRILGHSPNISQKPRQMTSLYLNFPIYEPDRRKGKNCRAHVFCVKYVRTAGHDDVLGEVGREIGQAKNTQKSKDKNRNFSLFFFGHTVIIFTPVFSYL